MKQLQRLPFGAGFNRATGLALLTPEGFRDLRNLELTEGRAIARPGMSIKSALSLGGLGVTPMTEVCALATYREKAIGAAVGYEEASRKLQFFTMGLTGLNPVYVADVGTVPADAQRPVVTMAESYRVLAVAHGEPDPDKRLATMVYDGATLTALTASLDDGAAAPVKFRGVTAWLDYLLGWGYGSASEPHEPHALRVSLPGQPTVFDATDYFLAGSPTEAVLAVAALGASALAFKQTETYLMVGTNRTDFGIVPLDARYGIAGARLWAHAQGALYGWSLEGPRRWTSHGPSMDLSIPLDLDGPSPADLVASGEYEDAFACYRYDVQLVEFHFGRRCYVLHLRDPNRPRWSYRENGVEIRCAGTLYYGTALVGGGGGAPAAPLGTATAGAFTATTSTVSAPFTYADVIGDESVEVWVKVGADAWAMKVNRVVANTVGETFALDADDGITPSTVVQVAVRLRRGLLYTAGYSSTNPEDWPAASRSSVVTAVGSGTPTDVQFLGGTVTSYGVKKYNHPFFSWTANPPGVSTTVLVSQTSDPDDAVELTSCPFAQTTSDPAGNFLVQSTESLRWFFVAHRQADGTLGPRAACTENPIAVNVEMGA